VRKIKLKIQDHFQLRSVGEFPIADVAWRVIRFNKDKNGIVWVPSNDVVRRILASGRMQRPGAALSWKPVEITDDELAEFQGLVPSASKICPSHIDSLDKWHAWRRTAGDAAKFELAWPLELRTIELAVEMEHAQASGNLVEVLKISEESLDVSGQLSVIWSDK